MAVRIRLKKMGRKARPFFRVCAVDARAPRDGRVIEELGTYDPMISDTDARAVLRKERVDYWLSVGAQPSEKARVLIKKYGSNGTHVEKQQAALESLKQSRRHHTASVTAGQPISHEERPQAAAEPTSTESPSTEQASETTS